MVTTYAATAYIIIEVINNLSGPFRLPHWIPTLVALLLVAGLPVAIIISWIFDITPQGIKKTESEEESNSLQAKPSKRKVRPVYVLNGLLIIAVIILAWPKIFRQDSLERLRSKGEKLTIAVLPFQNMTNDTTWNVWQEGIQSSLISSLSEVEDLKVRQKETVNNLLNSNGPMEYATISPAFAGSISKKLDADIYIYGSILKGGSLLRLSAQLVDTRTRDVLKSIEIDGPYKEDLGIMDSLRKKITDFMILSRLIKEFNADGVLYRNIWHPQTRSPEAYRFYVYGSKSFDKNDWPTARAWYLKALAIDSNYFDVAWELAWAYGNQGYVDTCIQLVIRNYKKMDQWSTVDQLRAKWTYNNYFGPPEESVKILEQIVELDDQSTMMRGLLAGSYSGSKQWDKALSECEKNLEIFHELGKQFLINNHVFISLIELYLETNQIRKAKKLCRRAERFCPDLVMLPLLREKISLIEKDTAAAERYQKKYMSLAKKIFQPYIKADSIEDTGWKLNLWGKKDSAEIYIKKALAMDPNNKERLVRYLFFLENHKTDNFDFEEYSTVIEKLMKLTQDKVLYYDYLDQKGMTYYKKGRPKEALEIFQKIVDEAPYKLYSHKSHLEEVKNAVAAMK